MIRGERVDRVVPASGLAADVADRQVPDRRGALTVAVAEAARRRASAS
jgi:hypothetical protein